MRNLVPWNGRMITKAEREAAWEHLAPRSIIETRERMDVRLVDCVRRKLNDPTAALVRWDRLRTGAEVPVWRVADPAAARALGLTVVE